MNYGDGIIVHCCVRFLVFTTMFNFYYFLDEFIKTILITDSLNSVYKNANTKFEITFTLKPKEACDILRENIVNRKNTFIKHDELVFGGTSNYEFFLEVFRFK